ncbi:unnamed protein product [Auanema sp. JU1783]|nr:unnamed protein product [Auanema sp. JU1783]
MADVAVFSNQCYRPRARSVERSNTVGTLSRVTSTGALNLRHVGSGADVYRSPAPLRGGIETLDDFEIDRYTSTVPYYWSTYRYVPRPLLCYPYVNVTKYPEIKPWQYDSSNAKRAIDLYRRGIIGFDQLEKNWVTPTQKIRRKHDFNNNVVIPAAKYGVHRYFYSFQ